MIVDEFKHYSLQINAIQKFAWSMVINIIKKKPQHVCYSAFSQYIGLK